MVLFCATNSLAGNYFTGAHKCHIKANTIYCDCTLINDIIIPENVTSVFLENFDISRLTQGIFTKNSRWSTLEKLIISDNTTNESQLLDFAFTGLENLRFLGVHHEQMSDVAPYAFYGLKNLETLDFSGNNYAPASRVFQSLGLADMPKLENVIFNMLQSYLVEPVDLKEHFFQSVTKNGTRKIRYLDVSNMNIGMANYNFFFTYNICNSIEHFAARNSTFQNVQNYVQFRVCKSLRRFDISGAIMPITRLKVDFQTTNFFCAALYFYFNIEEYNLDNIFHTGLSQPFVTSNFTLTLLFCPLRVKKVTLSNNLLKFLNASVVLDPVTEESVEWLDLSQNIIEYMSPKLLSPSVNMKHLDLTQNRLHVMHSYHPYDFEILVKALVKLEYLSLAKNSLASVPHKMLESNRKLVQLDLSDNRLTAIDFKISHLQDLQFLWLQGNDIKEISPAVQVLLEGIAYVNADKDEEPALKVDIGRNPLTCSCKESDQANIRWVQLQLGKILTGNHSEYICKQDNKEISIKDNAVQIVESYCQWQIRKHQQMLILSIGSCLLIICIIALTVIAIKIKRRRKMKKYYSSVLTSIKHGTFPRKYLVFLSFCSEDDNIVTSKILPQLQKKLQQLTETSKNLVCTGDTGFRPGYSISEELIRCIGEAAVTVLVVSNNYCKKAWCKKEIQETYDQSKPIILLMLEKVDKETMGTVLTKIFQRFTHAAWISNDSGEYLTPDWPVFCEAIIGLAGQSVAGSVEMSNIQKLENESDILVST